MASKKNRKKQNLTNANPRNYSELYKDDKSTITQSTATKTSAKGSTSVTDSVKGTDSVDWKSEYTYVGKDLRQLLIVSVVLFALVIGIGMLI